MSFGSNSNNSARPVVVALQSFAPAKESANRLYVSPTHFIDLNTATPFIGKSKGYRDAAGRLIADQVSVFKTPNGKYVRVTQHLEFRPKTKKVRDNYTGKMVRPKPTAPSSHSTLRIDTLKKSSAEAWFRENGFNEEAELISPLTAVSDIGAVTAPTTPETPDSDNDGDDNDDGE